MTGNLLFCIHVFEQQRKFPALAGSLFSSTLVHCFYQGQLLEGVECHIYLYCFTFDDINLNRAFVIIVLFPKKYSNKKVCANDMRKRNALGIY